MILKKIWQSSRFFVILYALVLLGGMTAMVFNWEYPLQTMATIWPILISAYTVLDRFVDIKTTQNLPKGKMSFGDLNKLRFIIFLCLVLFGVSFVYTRFAKQDFCMAEFGTAFGAAIVTYISGNKIIKGYKFSSPDKDKDGIPDEIQEEYYKWERLKKKEGVSEEFISFDYFLDENEELRKKLK